jgi:iron complex outermembrane receptor protein
MNPRLYRVRLASLAAQLSLCGCALAQGPEAHTDPTDMAYPVVITPTRLRQSLADVPASVTIITADTLRRYGITSIPEAMRLVPGMAVTHVSGNNDRVNYHGADQLGATRLNVLIDGVSANRIALSRVTWATLPVPMEDIDRIEVTRGPDSSSYGPNSMTAVINILTKNPKDVERGLVTVSIGSHDELNTTLRMATTLGSTSLHATVNTVHDSGYERTTSFGGDHDGSNIQRVNVRALHEFGDGSTLDLRASYVGGLREIDYVDVMQKSPPDQRPLDTQINARWSKTLSDRHELQVNLLRADDRNRQSWLACVPQAALLPEVQALYQANPDYIFQILTGHVPPTGGSARDDELARQAIAAVLALGPTILGTTTCGHANQNLVETRLQLEVQDTYVASDQLRVVAGLGLRYQRADHQALLSGKVGNSVRWLFGHVEYRPTPWITTNIGGYVESNSLVSHTFSPRAAVNVHLSDSQTIRAVYSEGTHAPDIIEQHGSWSYPLTDLTPPVRGVTAGRLLATLQSGGGLVSSERIASSELGYLLSIRRLGLALDTRIFDDRLSHLFTGQVVGAALNVGNDGAMRHTGVETQATWDVAPGWSGWMTYAYLLNRQVSALVVPAQYSRHSGSLGLTRTLSPAWQYSLMYNGASGDGSNELRYDRTDLIISHGFSLGAMPSSATLTMSYLDNPVVNINRPSVGYYTSGNDNRLNVRGALRLAF